MSVLGVFYSPVHFEASKPTSLDLSNVPYEGVSFDAVSRAADTRIHTCILSENVRMCCGRRVPQSRAYSHA